MALSEQWLRELSPVSWRPVLQVLYPSSVSLTVGGHRVAVHRYDRHSSATPVTQTLVFLGLAGLKDNMRPKVPKNWNMKRFILPLPLCLIYFYFFVVVVILCVPHDSWTKQVIDELQPLLHTAGYRNTEVITEQKWRSGMKGGRNREGARGKLKNFFP